MPFYLPVHTITELQDVIDLKLSMKFLFDSQKLINGVLNSIKVIQFGTTHHVFTYDLLDFRIHGGKLGRLKFYKTVMDYLDQHIMLMHNLPVPPSQNLSGAQFDYCLHYLQERREFFRVKYYIVLENYS